MLLVSLLFPLLHNNDTFVKGEYDADTGSLTIEWGFTDDTRGITAMEFHEMHLRTTWGNQTFLDSESPAIHAVDASEWPTPMTLNITGPFQGNFTYLFRTTVKDTNVSAVATAISLDMRGENLTSLRGHHHHHHHHVLWAPKIHPWSYVIFATFAGLFCLFTISSRLLHPQDDILFHSISRR